MPAISHFVFWLKDFVCDKKNDIHSVFVISIFEEFDSNLLKSLKGTLLSRALGSLLEILFVFDFKNLELTNLLQSLMKNETRDFV